MEDLKTKEPQYQTCVEVAQERGYETLGLRSNESWHEDPKHIIFRLSRYKFIAKMFSGYKSVLEIGCGDAFGSRIVQAEVEKFTAIDFDPIFIEDVNRRMVPRWQFSAFVHDMLSGPVPGQFDGVFALDVLEHIEIADEQLFLQHLCASLSPHGAAIIGIPSLESQVCASPQSKVGHVNCKTAPDLKKLLHHYFHTVFIFSMNDEVVHTGYHKMAHYIFAICADRAS